MHDDDQPDQIMSRRSQIKANRALSVSNRNSEEVATRKRRFVGVRQGSAKLRRSQARRRSISSEPVIGRTEARTASSSLGFSLSHTHTLNRLGTHFSSDWGAFPSRF
ncbi:hypothetical protein Acr_12g0011380 [Actinidia rufa]|uniref:Uncharacterized protein n=1 Tax=Actinidia rufa TaxID=165716 RepID=A0A7J0FKY9_9ERIC|nr:hypothetical protein Acr_12g0011380 [Actinidia rufa]